MLLVQSQQYTNLENNSAILQFQLKPALWRIGVPPPPSSMFTVRTYQEWSCLGSHRLIVSGMFVYTIEAELNGANVFTLKIQ